MIGWLGPDLVGSLVVALGGAVLLLLELAERLRRRGVAGGGQPIERHSPDGSSNWSHFCLPGCHCR